MPIQAEYRFNDNPTPIKFEIDDFIPYEEMNFIINETVKASFDDDGSYTPHKADAMFFGLILNICTNLDKSLIDEIGKVWTLVHYTDVLSAIYRNLDNDIATMKDYVDKIVKAKMTENPLKPVMKAFADMMNSMGNVDMNKIVSDVIKDEEFRQKFFRTCE